MWNLSLPINQHEQTTLNTTWVKPIIFSLRLYMALDLQTLVDPDRIIGFLEPGQNFHK